VKRVYGLLEKQFRLTFNRAARKRGITGDNLISILESRFDNMVYRLGFAASRNDARQLIRHGHFTINGTKVNIPSLILKPGDVVQPREKSIKIEKIKESVETAKQRGVPAWLEIDVEKFEGKVVALPKRDEITMPMNEQLIVELYSR
jgi:small subunit ribosomal protein S4